MKTPHYYIRNINKSLPANMLGYLIFKNSFFNALYMESIDDKKCQLRHLYLDHFFIQQKQDQN